MKIKIRAGGGLRLYLPLPTKLVLNPVTANVLSYGLTSQNIPVSSGQIQGLFDAICAYRAQHPDWYLVDVQTHDGVCVKIKL